MSERDDAQTLVEDRSSRRPIAPPSTSAIAFDDPPGQRYRTTEELGRGGMGEVVLVEDERIRRRVALKRLKPELDDDAVLRSRFAREAKIQAQLEHPAIVPVYDVGIDAEGSIYFTMKRIRGKSLAQVLRELSRGDAAAHEQFSKRRLLTAFGQICLAVHYAHEHGVVHRDIKPSNIMLGTYGEVYLLDWGIAKVLEESDAPTLRTRIHEEGDPLRTKVGDVVGTPGYMSPEQERGDPSVGPATDVYSLGVILFEILALRPMESGNDDARLPPELQALCTAATSLDVTARPPSARALHDAVEVYLDGDRDQELRRTLAQKHVSLAVESAVAPESGADLRRDALRGLGQALALDPKNRVALQTLVDLLRRPPDALPRDVAQAEVELTHVLLTRAGAVGALCYFLAFVATFVLRTQHVLDESSLHGMELAWCLASLAGVVTMRRPSYPALMTMFVLGIFCNVWALRSVMGPFAVVPGSLALHGVLYSLTRLRQVRLLVLAGVSAAWTVAVFGEGWGWLAETTRFTPGGMVVSSPLVELSPTFARLFLFGTVLALIAIPSIVAGLLRAAHARADDRTRLLMWQLQQLLPDEARPPA